MLAFPIHQTIVPSAGPVTKILSKVANNNSRALVIILSFSKEDLIFSKII